MKKKIIGVGVFALSLFVALGVKAGQVTVSVLPGYETPPGGEFNLSGVVGGGYAASVLVNGGYESFCLELNEDVSSGATYNYAVNPYGDAVQGGGNLGAAGPDGGDPISIGTAYLYYNFAKGILTGYDYSTVAGNGTFASRAAAAWALQNAIWWLEDENNATYTAASELTAGAYYLSIVSGLYGAGDTANANGAFGVHVLNLTTPSGGFAQDQLMLPDGGATVMLLGAALGGLVLVSRKLRRNTVN
jgi:hypothetical protein